MSAALAHSPRIGRRLSTVDQPEALITREVDGLVARLLAETRIPFTSLSKRVLAQLTDLKRVLSTNYLEAKGLPSKPLIKELALIAEKELRPYTANWKSVQDSPQLLSHLSRIFGPRELELRAEPYTEGAGLALRGFFCRASLDARDKFVIFLNTAHHPGAVSATLGHELGHYVYGSLVGETHAMTAFMEGRLSKHVDEHDELFADSLVALSAYEPDLMRTIGVVNHTIPGSADELFNRIKLAYELIGGRFNLNLQRDKMAAAWRVRYLASMTHFFKLRCALYQLHGV
jgi:hypothetical protein